jgi:hypothetical protein
VKLADMYAYADELQAAEARKKAARGKGKKR